MQDAAGIKGSVVVCLRPGDERDELLDWSADWAESMGRTVALLATHGPHGHVDAASPMAGLVAAARSNAAEQLRAEQHRLGRAHPRARLRGFTVHAPVTNALQAAARQAYAVVVAAPDMADPRDRWGPKLADQVIPGAGGVVVVVDPAQLSAVGHREPQTQRRPGAMQVAGPVVLGLSLRGADRSARFAFAHAAATGRLLLVVHALTSEESGGEAAILRRHGQLRQWLAPLREAFPDVPVSIQVHSPQTSDQPLRPGSRHGRPLRRSRREVIGALQAAAQGGELLVVGQRDGEAPLGSLPRWLAPACIPRELLRAAPCPMAIVP